MFYGHLNFWYPGILQYCYWRKLNLGVKSFRARGNKLHSWNGSTYGKIRANSPDRQNWRKITPPLYAKLKQSLHKVLYLGRNLLRKYWPYYFRPENTGHIISDQKLLDFCLDKLAFDIIISENNMVKKGNLDVKFKLMCIMIITDWGYSCYFHNFIGTLSV